MSSFGFRQPQFSEELAYLPIWLQNPQLETTPSDSGRDAQTASSSGRELKSLSIMRDSIGCEEGRYKDCYLFLSGDGSNSESGVAPSPGNLLHLSLHISLDADSTSTSSQLLYSSDPGRSSKLPSQHQVENLSRWDKKASQLEIDKNGVRETFPSLASTPEVANCESIQLLSNKQNRGIQSEANSNVPPAIMETVSPTLSKSGTHGKGKFPGNQSEDADVDGAVELSIAASEALVIHELMKEVESNSEGLEMGCILEAALRVKQARLEDLEDGCYRYHDDVDELDFLSDLDDSVIGDTFSDVGLSVSGSHVSGSDVSHVKGTPTVGENDDDHISGSIHRLDQQEDISLKETQEVDCNGGQKWLTRKSIAKYYIDETSFISESADIAVNQVSCMHRKPNLTTIPSQSSVNFNGLIDKAHEGLDVFPSQEVKCSYPSASDPLCSVIPCSIPLEDVSPANQNQDNAEVKAQNCFSQKSIVGMHGSDDQAVFTTGNEHCVPLVRRQLTTLKNDSKICIDTDPILEGERALCNADVPSKMCHQVVGSSGKEHEGLSSDKDEEQVQDSPLNRNVVDDVENCKKSLCEPGKDEAFLSLHSSIVLNRTRQRLQGCDLNDNNVSAARCVEQDLPENRKFNQGEIPQNMQSEDGPSCTRNLVRKRVRFSVETQHDQSKGLLLKSKASSGGDPTVRDHKKSKLSKPRSRSPGSNIRNRCLLGHKIDFKNLIFHRLEFLITGFSCAKERELGEILQKFGGIVLSDIPSYRSSSCKGVIRSVTQQLPVIICSRKLQTSKFLYGCAVNASILKAKWVTDSIAGGTIASTERYLVLPNQADTRLTRMVSMNQKNRIFDRVGIMLHGKPSFCRKLSLIIKHGGGEVFKTLQSLLWGLDRGKLKRGVIVAEDQSRALRHLQHCAEEQKIALMSANWIVKSLHLGKLFPLLQKEDSPEEIEASSNSMDWSQEI